MGATEEREMRPSAGRTTPIFHLPPRGQPGRATGTRTDRAGSPPHRALDRRNASTGPELSGTLVPGSSADWQTILHDGTALGDIRYTLRTDAGDLLYVQSRSVRHGSAEVLARLGRGEDVDPSEYTFRTNTQIATGAPQLDWLNKGVFVGVAGRQAAGVIYEIYLVA